MEKIVIFNKEEIQKLNLITEKILGKLIILHRDENLISINYLTKENYQNLIKTTENEIKKQEEKVKMLKNALEKEKRYSTFEELYKFESGNIVKA